MKTVNLGVVHRLLLVSMLNDEGKKGSTLTDLKNMLKIVEKVEITQEERQDIEMAVNNETNRVSWNPEKDITKEIDLTEDEFSKLKDIFKHKNEEKSFNFETLNPMLQLAEQLEIEV